MGNSSNSEKLINSFCFVWYLLAPAAAFTGFVFILLHSSYVTISLSDYSQIVDLTSMEIVASATLFLLALSAYLPLWHLSHKFEWSRARSRRLGLVWPLLVIVFFAVVAVDLLLVYFS